MRSTTFGMTIRPPQSVSKYYINPLNGSRSYTQMRGQQASGEMGKVGCEGGVDY